MLWRILDWGNKYWSSQVSAASSYKQEGKRKKKELAQEIVVKENELKMAQDKLKEWKSKPTADLTPEDSATNASTIANLEQQVQYARDDIRTLNLQMQEIDGLMANYEMIAENDKLWMFNSQQVFVPILKSFESVIAQGVKVMVSPRSIETEFMLN